MSRKNMIDTKDSTLEIDLDQFKLHLTLHEQPPLTFHFDTPSRRFYLSVIALVVQQMRQNNRSGSVPLEDHAQVLTLLNETVGGTAGSSEKKKLLPRIYRKWKSALPDMENAPLFKVVGRKKAYDESSALVYRFDRKTQDAWANLFEYKGSGENVRLRFSWEKAGIKPKNIHIVYGNREDTEEGRAWDRFIGSLQSDSQELERTDSEEIEAFSREPEGDAVLALKDFLKEPGKIEKIPLKTRLELIARLAMPPGSEHAPVKPEGNKVSGRKNPDRFDPLEMSDVDAGAYGLDQHVSQILMDNVSALGSNAMLYAAPELQEGRSSSPRSDVYALGVLLYQVVVGDLSRPLDADWKAAVKDDVLREDIAACVEALPEKRLANPYELTRRLATLDERRRVLLPLSTLRKTDGPSLRHRKRRWLAYGFAMAVILALLALPAWYYQKASRAEAAKKKVYQTNLPKIRELLENEKHVAAHVLARETEKTIPHDPTLQQYLKDATNSLDIETMPAGARVSYRAYNDLEGPWIDLGVTPIKAAMVPVGMHHFKFEKQGYQEREVVKPVKPRNSQAKEFEILERKSWRFGLEEKGRVPQGMLTVDGGGFTVPITGLPMSLDNIVLDRFFIDKTEVTNLAYKGFLDAGGYTNPKYWRQEFKMDGQVVPWAEAMTQFVDCTGRPGPSTWELGNYPDGQDGYPVSGVSWYEAAAYAEFKGKTLPTIYHWCRAAFPTTERITPLTPLIIPQSNIEGTGIAEAGRFPGTGFSGAKDMTGNVREWCWNGFEANRYCLGGTWQDPAYMFNEIFVPSAWDRSPVNGFRCAFYPGEAQVPNDLLKEINLGFYDPYTIPPYSKKAFEAVKAMFAYKPTPLNPVVESRKKGGRSWIRERVSIDAAYDKDRLIIYLDLPTGCKQPYKTLIYFPGGNGFYQTEYSRNSLWEPWDLIPENGRALVTPIYAGTFERGGKTRSRFMKKSFFQRFYAYLNDVRRTIDYLETRKDINTENIIFLGLCWGGIMGPIVASYEDRIKGLVLVSGGIIKPVTRPKPKGLVEPFVTIPVLMLNGKYDYVFPVKTLQKAMFDLIGTPPEHKKHVIYEAGHLPLPRAPMMKEIFAWLDKYQGPVDCGGNAGKVASVALTGLK